MASRFAALALVLLLPALPAPAQTKMAVQKIADGVWAAQPEKGANVGWFLYGDGVVAIDSGGDDGTAREILSQIAETTGGKPVRFLILTHSHADHSAGARAFVAAGAQVICHENAASPILGYITQPSGSPGAAAARKTSPTAMTISERIILFDGRRRADVQYLGPAHTTGDLVVILPAEKVLFVGDLAPNGRLPDLHLADADPAAWAKVLPRLAAAPVERMVPGHGTIGPKTGIADTLAYLRGLDELVQKLVRSGVRDEQLDIHLREPNNRIPNVPLSQAHLDNAKSVYRREKEKVAKPAGTPAAPPRRTPTPRTTS